MYRTATIYSQMNGDPSVNGVWSFGAPKTRVTSSCTVPGKRIFHESDSVASNAMGVLGSFNHDVVDAYKIYKVSCGACSQRRSNGATRALN